MLFVTGQKRLSNARYSYSRGSAPLGTHVEKGSASRTRCSVGGSGCHAVGNYLVFFPSER